MSEYFDTADVWTVLDLIVAEFESDPMSVQCFDLRLVKRAIELNRAHRQAVTAAGDRLQDAAPDLLKALKRYVEHYGDPLRVARAAIAKAEGR